MVRGSTNDHQMNKLRKPVFLCPIYMHMNTYIYKYIVLNDNNKNRKEKILLRLLVRLY